MRSRYRPDLRADESELESAIVVVESAGVGWRGGFLRSFIFRRAAPMMEFRADESGVLWVKRVYWSGSSEIAKWERLVPLGRGGNTGTDTPQKEVEEK